MSQLQIGLKTASKAILYGVSARVMRVADSNGVQADHIVPKELAISLGAGSANLVEVEPGHYVVEAYLPSGEILSTHCVVKHDAVARVELRARALSQDPAGWERLIRGSDVLDWGASSNRGVRDFAYPSAGGMFSLSSDHYFASHEDEHTSSPHVFITTTVPSLNGGNAWASLRAPQSITHGIQQDGFTSCHLVSESKNQRRFAVSSTEEVPSARRFWAVVEHEHSINVASLPVPWQSLPSGAAPWAVRQQPIEVLVADMPDKKAMVKVAALDEQFGIMLSYLGFGRTTHADTALRSLEDKVVSWSAPRKHKQNQRVNPYAMCAAGYVAIANASARNIDCWSKVISEVHDHCPWLPDASILKGRRQLQTACSENDLMSAFASFKGAMQLGLPLFSAGLQHLMDGLSILSSVKEEAAELRARVVLAAAHVDLGQPFTVFNLPRS